MENEVETVRAQWREDTRRMEEMGLEISRLKQEVVGHLSRASSRAASRAGQFGDQNHDQRGSAAPEPLLQAMEERLLKLSEGLRMREIEIASLKKTVQEQCTERGDLMRQVALCKATIDELQAAAGAPSGAHAVPAPRASDAGADRDAGRGGGRPEALKDSWMKHGGARQGFAQGRSRATPRRHAMR